MPMLIDGNRDSGQPIPLFHQFDQFRCGKEFHSVLWRVAKRLEEFGGDQHRHIVNLAAKHPRDLLHIEPGRSMSEQG